MRRLTAAIACAAFFVAAPCVVAGLIPWLITDWVTHDVPLPVRIAGVALIASGAAVLIQSFARFAVEGIGTPAPVAPTEKLVVGGLYRYVRNPMYLGVLAVIVGQALALGRPVLMLYAAFVAALFAAFVNGYEEPALHRRYGESYDAYRRDVPAWMPRRR